MHKVIFFSFSLFMISCSSPSQPGKNKTLSNPSSENILSSTPSENKKTPFEAYLTENINGGEILITSDDSVWIVDPNSKSTTSEWLGPLNFNIDRSTDPNYPYKITNTATKESINAKLGSMNDVP